MTHVVARFGAALASAALLSFVSVQAAPQGARAGGAAQQQNAATPRTVDGHPDLSGMWGGGGGGGGADKPDEKGNLTVLFRQRPCSEQQKDATAPRR